MAADSAPRRMTVDEYLAMDRASTNTRYEYYDGIVRAMSGGSLDHSGIKVNCVRALGNALSGKPCRVLDSDARVQVSPTRYVYPDATVSCAAEDRGKTDIIRSPIVVFEVLSPSTEYIDKGRKLDDYRGCPSVEEYILIDSERPKIEGYRRTGVLWLYFALGLGDMLDLTSIGVQIPVAVFYEGIEFPPDGDDQ